jgi:hypothetical protein
MVDYLLSLFKRLFNFPDWNELKKSISNPINLQLKKIDKKFTILLIMISIFQVLGFVAILSCLENGFHWSYLFKV